MPTPDPPAPGRLLRRILAEGAVSVGVLAAVTAWVCGDLATRPGSVVGRQFAVLRPEDYLGTLWFYRWFHDALVRGVPFLAPDTVCAPTGTLLGDNFPNQVDALLAAPLIHLLPFPTSVNLFFAAIPVLSALAATLALRGVAPLGVALAGGVLYGFNPYALGEIAAGRPTMALTFVVPLFVAAWGRALASPGRRAPAAWCLLAGACGALTVYYHPVYALISVVLGLGVAGGRALAPAPGVSRLRPVVAGLGVLLLAGFLSSSYVYQVTALQRRLPVPSADLVQSPTTRELLPPWDPRLWRYLGEVLVPAPAPEPRLPSRALARPVGEADLLTAAGQSLPVSFPWRGGRSFTDPSSVIYPGFLGVLAVAAGLAGSWRSRGWLALAGVFYLFALGPWACAAVRPAVEPLLVGGARVRMPAWYLYDAWPTALLFVKPVRLFPGFLLALLLAFGAGAWDLAGRAGPWLTRLRVRPGGVRHAVAAVLVLIPALAGLDTLAREIRADDVVRPYTPDPFLVALADDPDDFALAELPAGLGHGLAGFQLVHEKRRAEGPHDEVAALRVDHPPSAGCLQTAFLQALWGLGRVRPGREPVDPFRDALLDEARRDGFRYVVVYPGAYAVLEGMGVSFDLPFVLATLQRWLGPPVYRGDLLVAFQIPGVAE